MPSCGDCMVSELVVDVCVLDLYVSGGNLIAKMKLNGRVEEGIILCVGEHNGFIYTLEALQQIADGWKAQQVKELDYGLSQLQANQSVVQSAVDTIISLD